VVWVCGCVGGKNVWCILLCRDAHDIKREFTWTSVFSVYADSFHARRHEQLMRSGRQIVQSNTFRARSPGLIMRSGGHYVQVDTFHARTHGQIMQCGHMHVALNMNGSSTSQC
jgi:hypothetical protein